MSELNKRETFLLQMYTQMWNNINRHILIVWQSLGVFVAIFTALVLTGKKIWPLDWSVSLIVVVALWQIATAIDANFWYNRNLAIITNIERQFLNADDSKQIHYFFTKQRRATLLDHFQIHAFLGFAVLIGAIAYHFAIRVWPGIGAPWGNFEVNRLMPYLVVLVGIPAVIGFYVHQLRGYQKLLERSPGREVQTSPSTQTENVSHTPV